MPAWGLRLFPLLACAASAAAQTPPDWAGWREPTGMGLSVEKDLPLRWGGKDGENYRASTPR